MTGIYAYPPNGYLRFTIGSIVLPMNQSAFIGTDFGMSLPERYGYDRKPNSEYFRKGSYGYKGASHRKGPVFRYPYTFEFNFSGITETARYTLRAIFDEQQATGAFVRLDDYILPLQERSPRTRARVGAVATTYVDGSPVLANYVLFYPIFNLDNFIIVEERAWQQGLGRPNMWSVSIKADEADPDIPVPITEDITA